MSASATEIKASQPEKSHPVITPTSEPIGLLPTEAAHLYTNLHPILVLTLLYLSFSYLVNDPVTTLSWTIIPVAVLQTVYCATCLPPSSGSSTPPPGSKNAKKKRVQFAKLPVKPKSKITTTAISLFLTVTLAAPILTAFIILFGGPFLTHFWHNLLCGSHLAFLGVFPLFYVHGVNARMWREISGAFLPFDEVWGATIGTLVGAWLGAVPIPLDWDREWQKWPVTIVTGAYIGWAVFRLLGAYVFHGKRISLTDEYS